LSIIVSFTGSISGLLIAYLPIRLQKKYPELYEKSRFKLKRKLLVFFIIFNVSYAIFSIIIMAIISPLAVLISFVFYGIAIIYYIVRKKWLMKRGVNLEEICKTLPSETLEV